MQLNRLSEIAGPTVMEEEHPLAGAPQGRGAKLIASRLTLLNIVRQARSHAMHEQV
jgi:hypothetical protein